MKIISLDTKPDFSCIFKKENEMDLTQQQKYIHMLKKASGPCKQALSLLDGAAPEVKV